MCVVTCVNGNTTKLDFWFDIDELIIEVANTPVGMIQV